MINHIFARDPAFINTFILHINDAFVVDKVFFDDSEIGMLGCLDLVMEIV